MKLRNFVYIGLVSLIAIPASGQLKFGVRGGVNSANFKIEEFRNSDYSLEYESSTEVGYHFGVMGQLKIVNVFIQPEILFSTSKMDYRFSDLSNADGPITGTQKFNKLDVPVMAGMKFGPLKLQAGPIASVIVNSKADLLEEEGIEQAYRGATFGYQAGLGIELTSLLIDVKYEGNLSALGESLTLGNQDFNFDQRMNQWILSLGFLF